MLSILGDADAAALGRVVAALRRLDLGIYGTCTECATSIEPDRLFVLPETPTCFDCALETERTHGSPTTSIGQRSRDLSARAR